MSLYGDMWRDPVDLWRDLRGKRVLYWGGRHWMALRASWTLTKEPCSLLPSFNAPSCETAARNRWWEFFSNFMVKFITQLTFDIWCNLYKMRSNYLSFRNLTNNLCNWEKTSPWTTGAMKIMIPCPPSSPLQPSCGSLALFSAWLRKVRASKRSTGNNQVKPLSHLPPNNARSFYTKPETVPNEWLEPG